jgi:hypothetical protein
MHKKILAICAALVAIGALAIPAAASAAVTLREGGASLAAGAKITATQDTTDPISVFSASGLLVECNENWMTGVIHRNDGTNVEGTIESAKFQSNLNETGTACKSPQLGPTTVTIPILTNEPKTGEGRGEGHWCIKNIAGEDKFEVQGRACTSTGTQTLTFILESSIATCSYTRSTPVSGTFTTTTGANATTLSVTGEPEFSRESGGILCPAVGKITKMKFELFTDPDATHSETALQMDDLS